MNFKHFECTFGWGVELQEMNIWINQHPNTYGLGSKNTMKKINFLDFDLTSCLFGNFEVTQDNFILLKLNNSVLVIHLKKFLSLK
jgi:hypothetical protein